MMANVLNRFKSESSQSRSGAQDWNRYFKLKFLKTIWRPFRKVENTDIIATSERQLDASLSKIFREFLKTQGLASLHLTTSFGQMHYYDSAPGSSEHPFIMLHGIGSSGQCFAILALMLKEKRRVILPDLFHFCGFSTTNNAVMNHSEHVKSIVELIENLAPQGCDFCGLSLGGWLGLKIAAQRPELIKKIILLNSAGLKHGHYQLRDTLSFLSWKKFKVIYPGIMRAFPYEGTIGLSNLFRRSVFRLLKDDAVRDFIRTVHTSDFLEDDLARIKCPVLVLWGREDRLLSPQIAESYAKNLPQVEAWWVENCAHILCLEAPIVVYEACLRFLNLSFNDDNNFTKMMRRTAIAFDLIPIASKIE